MDGRASTDFIWCWMVPEKEEYSLSSWAYQMDAILLGRGQFTALFPDVVVERIRWGEDCWRLYGILKKKYLLLQNPFTV